MEQLGQLIEDSLALLRQHVGDAQDVALLDFPHHRNAGDSLIWLGELSYLKRLGCRAAYVADAGSFSLRALEKLCPAGPVLFHGGGNFGDLWPTHQVHREETIGALLHRRVILLPQTIHFQDERNLDRAMEVFARHPDLTIFIRDQEGAEKARRWFPQSVVQFCPDLALGVGSIPTERRALYDVVEIRRSDRERKNSEDCQYSTGTVHLTTDWSLSPLLEFEWAAWSRLVRTLGNGDLIQNGLRRSGFRRMARLSVDSAIRLIASARVVVTDRLHATILAALCGVPVVALDNSYGKVAAIFKDYASSLRHVHWAEDAQQAATLAESLAR